MPGRAEARARNAMQRRASTACALRQERLVAHEAPEILDGFRERSALWRRIAESAGWTNFHDFLDATGTRRHHGDPVGKTDSLAHIVRDEEHGLRRAAHDRQQ